MDSNSIITIFFFSILFSTSLCEDDEHYTQCRNSFKCGTIENITYPFWGDDRPEVCGREGFKLQCPHLGRPVIEIDMQEFHILKVNPSNYNATIARLDLWNWESSFCPESPQAFHNTTSKYTPFHPLSTVENIVLFYNCKTKTFPGFHTFSCNARNGTLIHGAYAYDFLPELEKNCEFAVQVPVLRAALEEQLSEGRLNPDEVLKQGFEVDYDADRELCDKCKHSGGICGSTTSTPSQFSCLCRDHPYPSECPKNEERKKKVRKKIIIGVVAAFVGILITCIIFYIYLRYRNKKQNASPFLSRNISSDPSSLTDKEKGHSYYGVHVFTYTELEEATNNFDPEKELGDGGFGTVYYGQLRDGRAVAVKRLYENNYKRVEQFMNEVEILTRLRHQHLVSLYGCTSRHSRELLLVYEYISNGTVADHLHGDLVRPGALPWSTRMNIAIETACALSYLHASEIIHRDVKTNNILLDKNFCVKVADFGLSRLFPIDVTHVSTAPAGTPGYVDPEYHQCYQLTSKSDVYSFGVVLIELISSMPAVDITRHRHEINLSNMAINKIQNHELHELVDPGLEFESDDAVRRIITEVADLAFKCLQSEKEMRPSMAEVLEALKDIQNDGNNEQKAEAPEKDNTRDDAVLMKNDSLPSSDGIIWT